MRSVVHRVLPERSGLLAGSRPPDDQTFRSKRLQIWLNRTNEGWRDPAPHFHQESDEIFIVLEGELEVEVEGQRLRFGPNELCAFPAGVVHAVVEVHPPHTSLMIRAPSVQDKIYVASGAGPVDADGDTG